MARTKQILVLIVLATLALGNVKCKEERLNGNDANSEEVEPDEWKHYWLIVGSMIAFQAIALFYVGQPIICKTGKILLWCGDVKGSENSQHITDWYTFSHIIHGLLYYWFLGIILPGSSVGLRFLFAVAIEIAWELLENSPMIINRYRSSALAQGYCGDSILNSVCDTFSMSFGFYLSSICPVWTMVTFAISAEIFCAYMIRDNLTLNVINLVHPIDAISSWQSGVDKSEEAVE